MEANIEFKHNINGNIADFDELESEKQIVNVFEILKIPDFSNSQSNALVSNENVRTSFTNHCGNICKECQ